MMKAISLLAVCLLAGCAGSPLNIATSSPEEMATLSPTALCNAFDWARPGGRQHTKLLAEVERREAGGVRKPGGIEASARPQIRVNMSEPVVNCYARLAGASQ